MFFFGCFSRAFDLFRCAESVLSCQEMLSFLEALPVPTYAIINGLTQGGGLELCLACDYRLADWQHGRMGLPEVQIGVLPGLWLVPLLCVEWTQTAYFIWLSIFKRKEVCLAC